MALELLLQSASDGRALVAGDRVGADDRLAGLAGVDGVGLVLGDVEVIGGVHVAFLCGCGRCLSGQYTLVCCLGY